MGTLHVWNTAGMDDDADVKMILTAPPPENWKRPVERPRITWLNTVQRDLSLQPHAKRSRQPDSEPPSVEAGVYVHVQYGATLLMVHARKEKVVVC